MSKRNSTVKIENGKVVFSKEILSYFESIRTEENGVWIDKYFEYLSDESNLTARKYNLHHIRPCCTFKDEEHKNRKETQLLGDEFNGNIIKISVYNHLLAHYCLWKIYDDWDSKNAIQKMCGQKKYIGDLTEDELIEIAKLKEECAKENQTEEERKEYEKQYREENKDELKKKSKIYREKNKEELSQRHKNWYEKNKDKELARVNEWTENNQDRVKKNKDNWYQKNKDSILKERKDNRLKYLEKERNYRRTHRDKVLERNNRPCKDPIYHDVCTWCALKHRISRNKELYGDVKLPDCLIKDLMIIPQPNA